MAWDFIINICVNFLVVVVDHMMSVLGGIATMHGELAAICSRFLLSQNENQSQSFAFRWVLDTTPCDPQGRSITSPCRSREQNALQRDLDTGS